MPLTVKNCVLVPQKMNMLVTGAPKVTVSAAPMELLSIHVLLTWLGVVITALRTVPAPVRTVRLKM